MAVYKVLFSFILVVRVCEIHAQIFSKEPHYYDDCKGRYQKRLGMQDRRIPDDAIRASTFNPKRLAHQARLGHSSGAWSPSTQNAYQWLEIDLGSAHIITQTFTQGRQGSDEYVREFFLEYSDDGETWRRYTNQFGISKMFDGNLDDSSTAVQLLLYPVVARYVRFNPQRWNMVISLRVEIMGCPYNADTSSFDGESFIEYDTSQNAIQSTDDLLELRFKTDRPDGVVFYASGNQRDMLVLELRRGFLFVRIDLGSTSDDRGKTEVRAASMLDDNQWHEVIIKREKQKMTVVVDRLINIVETKGLFYRLDIDKFIYIGGVPYYSQDGITVKYSLKGCIQNLNFNGARLIRDAMNMNTRNPRVTLVNNVNSYCNLPPKIPVTFPSLESFIRVSGDSGTVVHVSFDFRTHDSNGLLVFHAMDTKDSSVTVKINNDGHVEYRIISTTGQIIEDVVRNTDAMSETDGFTDGLWHSFYLLVNREKVNCTVDRNSKVSQRKLNIIAKDVYFIGGHELHNGFRGCMRNVHVAQKEVDLKALALEESSAVGVEIGSCGILDRCTPNPCEHGGICQQTWNMFTCDCQNSGYKGELCHISSYFIGCELHKQYSNKEGREDAWIDPDGSGPLAPFLVSCNRDENGQIVTYVKHDSMGPISVDGYQEPGSYVRKIKYTAKGVEELEEVVERATSCKQNVVYRCHNSRLLTVPAEGDNDPNIKAFGWWVGRTYQPMFYWGGAAPGSGKCACGLKEEGCGGKDAKCYCDAENSRTTMVDQGYLVHKEYLPVLEVHFGDTGSTTDQKWAQHEIGELECTGDNLFDNTVTFTMPDGALEFATFEAYNAGDIWYQFKTTTSDGVMIHCAGQKGTPDFVEVRLMQSDTIQFRYDVGNGVAVLSFKSPSPLNDDTWHTVHVEKNRKQAWMRIDDYKEVTLNEDADLIRHLDLESALTVGSLVGYQSGYVGCMRGLRVNGRLMDMMSKLRGGEVYGVRAGCVGKCASSPCFHGGTCREGYSSYTCDCSYTPWRGWNCGREVGVNLKSNYMIEYKFDENQGLSASDFQYATIGFSTKVKQGILMQLRNEANTEYITVSMNNNGGVKVAMDVGFERVEVNTPTDKGVDYANSQVHVVRVTRSNKGRDLTVQVDNYPAGYKRWEVSEQSDTILDNPKYLYIGNNDTSNTNRGFEGCIYQMQVDNIFPLKRAFQDPKPNYIKLTPESKVREDMCGFEEITVSPEPIKTRPYSGVLQNVTYHRKPEEGLSTTEAALLGVGCALLVILIIAIIIFFCRRMEGADYQTEEAKGAELADNPDTAIVYNQTGLPNMTKSYEYFM